MSVLITLYCHVEPAETSSRKAHKNSKCNITPSLRAFPYFSNIALSLFSHTSLEEGKSALA